MIRVHVEVERNIKSALDNGKMTKLKEICQL